jgi:hypothetical protein
MPFRLLPAAVLVNAVALTAPAAADEAVEIKPPLLKAGDRYKVTKTERTKTTEEYQFGGKKESKDKEETREVVYTEEVLTVGADPETPAKQVRVYEKFEAKGGKDPTVPPLNTRSPSARPATNSSSVRTSRWASSRSGWTRSSTSRATRRRPRTSCPAVRSNRATCGRSTRPSS